MRQSSANSVRPEQSQDCSGLRRSWAVLSADGVRRTCTGEFLQRFYGEDIQVNVDAINSPEHHPAYPEELDIIRPVPDSGIFFEVLTGYSEGVVRVRHPIRRRACPVGLAGQRRRHRFFIDPTVGGHEHRLEPEQALVPVLARDPLPHDESEQEAGTAGQLRIGKMANRRQAPEVVGTDVPQHRVHERVAQRQKLRVGPANGQLALEGGVAAALGQPGRPQDVRRKELEERPLPLQLAAVPRQETLGERSQVVQRQVRRQFAPVRVERVTRKVAEQAAGGDLIGPSCPLDRLGDLLLGLPVEVPLDQRPLVDPRRVDLALQVGR